MGNELLRYYPEELNKFFVHKHINFLKYTTPKKETQTFDLLTRGVG